MRHAGAGSVKGGGRGGEMKAGGRHRYGYLGGLSVPCFTAEAVLPTAQVTRSALEHVCFLIEAGRFAGRRPKDVDQKDFCG